VIAKIYMDEELTGKERLLAGFRFHSTLTLMEGALLQYELGVIDKNVLDSLESELFMLTHGTEFSRSNWEDQASSFSPQTQNHVADVISTLEKAGM